MRMYYIPPKQSSEDISKGKDVVLYSSGMPIVVAASIIALNNIFKLAWNMGWALMILELIATLIRFAQTRNNIDLVKNLKRLAGAGLLMWMIPYLPDVVDCAVDSFWNGVNGMAEGLGLITN